MNKKTIFSFVILSLMLILLFLYAVNTGSIKVTYIELIKGIFFEHNEDVSTIIDLRLPRIVISILSGAALAVSGVLFQAVLKNPLADPGIIGISSAASFVSTIIIAFFPQLFFFSPIFAFLGGIVSCVLVYSLSHKGGFSPLRIILVGIAINAVFSGLTSAFSTMSGEEFTGASSIINANISMKTWEDVKLLAVYTIIGLIMSFFVSNYCNLMALEHKTIRGLGVSVHKLILLISVTAVLLASINTAIVGTISFIGLIVPHLSRLMIGNNHKVLIPFSVILGAFIMLLADTVGRLIAYPYEISPAIIMSVVGGPFFIILLIRSDSKYGN